MLSTTAPRELADAIGVRIESISIRYNSSDEFTATVDHAPTAGLLKFVGHYASGTADPVEISVCDGRLRASAADLTITGTPGHRAQIALSMTGYHRFVTAA